jgi:hypothetical protein
LVDLHRPYGASVLNMLLIEFVAGTHLFREPEVEAKLPIVRNGPPGTFVVYPSGRRKISLPTDQIVFTDDTTGAARVGFGGMQYDGIEDGKLVFRRVRDLAPAETLAPERGVKMTLDPYMVAAISVGERRVWPLG